MTERTILVTGASKGIGRAIAGRLARDGFSLAIHYGQDRAGAEATQDQASNAGVATRLLSFDISDREGCRAALERDMESHGTYYGVVLNAGIARDNAFPAMTDTDWDDVLGTNLDGFYNVLRPVVMPMVSARKGGRIVTLSSVSGLMGNRGQVNYSAAKGRDHRGDEVARPGTRQAEHHRKLRRPRDHRNTDDRTDPDGRSHEADTDETSRTARGSSGDGVLPVL
jgi:NAD(P)-dependent dehydrogenase (short-subunit alcohol dehydrogenase family)